MAPDQSLHTKQQGQTAPQPQQQQGQHSTTPTQQGATTLFRDWASI